VHFELKINRVKLSDILINRSVRF